MSLSKWKELAAEKTKTGDMKVVAKTKTPEN